MAAPAHAPAHAPHPAGWRPDLLTGGAVVALLLGMARLWEASAAANGTFTFALDDAYIHLGMARTLAEHGTWGVNPGEFASATSSPLYTALLAAVFLVWTDLRVSLVLNFLAGAAVLALVAAHAPTRASRALALGSVLVLGPLPYLGALGMEHVLHAALVLGLARLGLGDRPRLGALAALSAAAVLTRFESVFVIAPLAALLGAEGRWRPAFATAGGGVAALLAFGAFSLAQGGLFVPNSILMKSALANGWEGLWRLNLQEGLPVFVLAGAAAAAAATATRHEARALGVFVATALLHLVFARIGWLFRYEGYLVIWGLAVLAPRLASGPVAALLALAILLPAGVRTYDALRGYVPATRAIHDNDVVLAQVAARAFPDATLGVHNIGALAWFTDAPILDLAGLATTEVTRLHLDRKLSGAKFGELLAARRVAYGWTDRPWMAAELPPGLTEVATLDYENAGKPAATRIWAGPGGDPTTLADALARAHADGLLPGFVLAGRVATDVPLDTLALEGVAVQREAGVVAFYTSGTLAFAAPATGELTLSARGTPADGRGPRFRVYAGDRLLVEAPPSPTSAAVVRAGPVTAGEPVRLVYDDDTVDASGNDRNLWIERIRVTPG